MRHFDILLENANREAAVAIIQSGDKWLLGLSTASDDRNRKWCFPGGGIKKGESPQQAAVREAYEELGVKSRAIGKPFTLPNKSWVYFVLCKALSNQQIKPNKEFTTGGFFSPREFDSLKLYYNVKLLINKAK